MLRHCLLFIPLLALLGACQPDRSGEALGTLERDRVLLTATANEIVRALPVAEGSRVEEGTVLARLDDSRQQAVLARARAEEASARAALARMTNGERAEDIDESTAKLEAARADVLLAERELADLTVVATRSGRLDSLPYNLGERVPVGAVLAALQADSAPYARVYVPETALAHYPVGQSMRVRVDGLADPLNGRLRWISQEPAFTPYYALNEQDRARLVYLAEIDLPAARDLPSGLPVQAEPADDGEPSHE